MNCGICGESKQLLCGSCANHAVLRPRINVIKAIEQVEVQKLAVETTLQNSRAAGLEAQILALQKQLQATKAAIEQCKRETKNIRSKSSQQITSLASHRAELKKRSTFQSNEIEDERRRLDSELSELEIDYKRVFHQSLACQNQCLRDLLIIFPVRRRRRRHGQQPDTLLGFGTVPNAQNLGFYTPAVVNSGLERVASFSSLCAAYLGVQLPFRIYLPTRKQLLVAMGYGTEQIPLRLVRTVRELLRSDPNEFYEFCRSLAMLIIDVATLAARLGVPRLQLEDISKLNELITHIALRLGSQVNAGIEIQVHSVTLPIDIEAMQDHLITCAEVDAHAQWSVVDVDEAA